MYIILKNLFTTLRRYPTAFLLDLAGLYVAFGAAALAIVAGIMAQTVTLRTWRTANENPVESIKTE